MHGTCPNCSARLNDFAFDCGRCGWNLDAQIESAGKAEPVPVAAESSDGIPIASMQTEAELLMDRAADYVEQENFSAAIKFLNRAIVDAPPERLGELYALRGYSKLKSGQFEKAEDDCTLAIERFWTQPQSFAWRAAARGEQSKWRLAFDDLARACEEAGDQPDPYLQLMDSYSEAASDHFREMIKAGRDSPQMFFERGWIYYRLDRYDRAARDFKLALDQDPKHPPAALGMAKTRLGEKAAAREELDRDEMQEIIRLCDLAFRSTDPEWQFDALKIRAKAKYAFGHYARAAKDMTILREKCAGDAGRLIQCGTLRQQLQQHVEAISDFSDAIETDPHNYFALQRRGDSYQAIRNYQLAIDDYTKYLCTHTEDLAVRIRRGQSYLKLSRPDLSLADFDRALKIESSNIDAILGRARIFTKRNQLDLALTEAEKAVRLDNRNHEAFAALAEVYVGLCDYPRAIEEFTRAIRLAPYDEQKAENLYRRGTSQYELSEYYKAADDFKASLELRKHHAGTWIWNSAVCSKLEDWPGAILSLENAITMRPSMAGRYLKLGRPVARRAVDFFRHELQRGKENADVYRSLGLAWHFLGDYKQAVVYYTGALSIEPDDHETLMRRGQAYGKAGEHEPAGEDFTKIIRRDLSDHLARYHRASARTRRGRYQVALMDVVKAIKQFPGNPVYHVLHGDLLQIPDATGTHIRYEKVIRAYDRALRIDSSDPETLRKRGNANMLSDRLLHSVDDFTRALELDPTRTDILVERGFANLKRGQHDNALSDFEIALGRDNRLARAYAGRAAALTATGRHEYALIWLTKALHRFDKTRDLAEILFARGKSFYQMRRVRPAINNFSQVVVLFRADARAQIPARVARAIAWAQLEHWKRASDDFKSVLKFDPDHSSALAGMSWLSDLSQPTPELFMAPDVLIKPSKPAVVAPATELLEIDESWSVPPPFDSWILRIRSTIDAGNGVKEYGPLTKRTLEEWAAEGRIDAGMKLLRADWSKWRDAEKVLPSIARRVAQGNMIPEIQLRRRKSDSEQ